MFSISDLLTPAFSRMQFNIISLGVMTARLGFRLTQASIGNHGSELNANIRRYKMAVSYNSTAILQT
jgi:hypothetical protein